ncbi:hypothetical protein JHK82_027005 [Glycine max]|nr:hypothetical protein JHK82_027005 [Glycine max]
MALITLFSILFFMLMASSSNAYWPPSPDYRPSSKFRPVNFYRGFNNLWGPQHQSIDQNALTIWLDSSSGSGFKSNRPFRSGYFGASIKLHPGYTAGVITAFYFTNDLSNGQLSNNEAHPGFHDEVDIEFLGTTFGKPYTLQTNVYIRGSGDGTIIGREMKFHLWFDPTQNFHHYAILWSPKEIIFLVDDIPIRRYPRKSAETFPLRPMWLYGSIWDASSWATEDGKYKADYRYQPFVAKYTNFRAGGCSAYASRRCRPVSASPYRSGGLTRRQYWAMRWVQKYHMVYNYCQDPKRDHRLTPECWG